MTAARTPRRALLGAAFVAYLAVSGAFALLEVPGLGIGHFFYVPIVLVALATDAFWGICAGLAATALYAGLVIATPRLPASDAFTVATAIRFVTFASVGAVVGRYSSTNRTLVSRLQEQTRHDFLTGLLNTRVFDESLARRCREGHEFVLLLGDMDNLKHVNDAHGHDAGNRAICRVGELLAREIRDGDELARIGGDEFALLTDGTPDEVTELTRRVQRAAAREGFDISFGWCISPPGGSPAIELFRKADDRLYAAKLLRRNQRTVLRVAAQDGS